MKQLKRSAATSPNRERAPARVPVPTSLEPDAAEIHRANPRLAAAGVGPPFTTEVLWALPPVTVSRALASLREAGLLGDGPAWTMHAAAARAVGTQVQDALSAELKRSRDLDR
jgi:hypothetical protein